MNFVIKKEQFQDLLLGTIDKEGWYEKSIVSRQHGRKVHIRLEPSAGWCEQKFLEEDCLCDIEYSVHGNSVYIKIYVSEYRFRRLIAGLENLEETINKQRKFPKQYGPLEVDLPYKLVVE